TCPTLLRDAALALCAYRFFVVSFFFNATAPPEIYTLSLHDALPIWDADADRRRQAEGRRRGGDQCRCGEAGGSRDRWPARARWRSEEHTSELQSLAYLVCRLLLEKKKTTSEIDDTRPTTAIPALDPH